MIVTLCLCSTPKIMFDMYWCIWIFVLRDQILFMYCAGKRFVYFYSSSDSELESGSALSLSITFCQCILCTLVALCCSFCVLLLCSDLSSTLYTLHHCFPKVHFVRTTQSSKLSIFINTSTLNKHPLSSSSYMFLKTTVAMYSSC